MQSHKPHPFTHIPPSIKGVAYSTNHTYFLPSTCLEDLVELVDLSLATEEGLVQDELGKDAPHGPEVDGGGVALGSQEEFWSAVPQCHDHRGVVTERGAVLPGQTKVPHLGGCVSVRV